MYLITNNCFNISVRNLVEFIFSTGNIDNRSSGSVPDIRVMQEGARLHRKIQHSMGSAYHAEVALKQTFERAAEFEGEDEPLKYLVQVEGRADGIICDLDEDGDGNKRPIGIDIYDGLVVIDEIKTVQRDISKISEPEYVHKAQALVYAYIFSVQNKLDKIALWVTYCNALTEEVVRFKEEYEFKQLEEWFDELIDKLFKWTDFLFVEREKRNRSILELTFPYEYRKGQKSLVASVYRAIEANKPLFIQAPTGVGKTLSTVYPSVQAIGRCMADKLFYLTSKTITRTVAEDTFSLLRKSGLHMRTITLTAKDKICLLDERDCNPDSCECAKGHFDRVNDAVFDILTNEMNINRDTIIQYALKHKVCPFEMSLDISYWCDGIVCDYNYVFDPDACLKRYFGEGNSGDYIFLVDESHNLVDRARNMYSATLIKEDFLRVKKLYKVKDRKLYRALEKCNNDLLEMKRHCDTYLVIDNLSTFPASLDRLYSAIQKYMDKTKNERKSVAEKEADKELVDLFFKVRHFLNMYDCMDEKYVPYTEHLDNGDFAINLYCVDPSGNIGERIAASVSTVFFSATLLPINYFKEMLSGNVEDMAVYAHSSFDENNKCLVAAKDVSSRYKRRGEQEYRKVSEYIIDITQQKSGKYMVFFPSYSFMKSVYDIFTSENVCNALQLGDDSYNISDGINVVIQEGNMSEKKREDFLKLFSDTDAKTEIVGFCVMGGIFAEGIDLKEESLIGAIIVGTGLPMICRERNILRDYFDEMGKDGYSYAYVYPGMNKVLQAAGRVIRTDNDRGIIALLDDRFNTNEYRRLFPREWSNVKFVDKKTVSGEIADFWIL